MDPPAVLSSEASTALKVPVQTATTPLAVQFESLLRHLRNRIQARTQDVSKDGDRLDLVHSKLCLWANDVDCSTDDREASVADILELLDERDKDVAAAIRAPLSLLIHAVLSQIEADTRLGRTAARHAGLSLGMDIGQASVTAPFKVERNRDPNKVEDFEQKAFGAIADLRRSTESIRKAYETSKLLPVAPRPGKVVLCFDGGGVRSLSSLIIFQKLMEAVEEILEQDPTFATLPRDFFDYIFGSSSGGIIAIMLGRLQMTVDRATNQFTSWAGEIFKPPGPLQVILRRISLRSRYSTRKVRRAYRQVVGEFEPDVLEREWRQNDFSAVDDRCRTGVFAYRNSDSKPFLFRTYEKAHDVVAGRKTDSPIAEPPPDSTLKEGGEMATQTSDPLAAHSLPIWQAARATSAAPSYFGHMEIRGQTFLDGGIGSNNPSLAAYFEVLEESRRLNTLAGASREIVIVSIGSGRSTFRSKPTSGPLSDYRNILRLAKSMLTNTQDVHYYLQAFAGSSESMSYFRFDAPTATPIKIDEWKSKGKIEAYTREYLDDAGVRDQIRRCAELIVKHRRKRL